MKWEFYISYFCTIKLDWENEYERGRVGRVACPETILGDSCHCHGNYGFRVGRHDCQRGITVYRGGFAGDTVYVDLDRECLPVGDRGFLVVLVFVG